MEKEIIFFDDICILCSRTVRWVYRHDVHGRFYFSAVGSGIYRDIVAPESGKSQEIDSIVLKTGDRAYFRSDAVLKIATKLRFPFPLLSVFYLVPRSLRDHIYNWIAKNRYRWFGKKESCFVPDADMRQRVLH